VNGAPAGRLHFERADGWREASVELPSVASSIDVVLTPLSADWVDHHVWLVQAP
jgi:hypothetical protein